MKKVTSLAALVLLFSTAKAHAIQLVLIGVVGILGAAGGTVGGVLWGPSYSASKASGTFPTAVAAGDKTTHDVKKVIFGARLSREVALGARAEAQTFLANDESYENVADKYPMLSAAIDEANRQGAAEGVAVNPYSLAEGIANFAE